MFEQELAKLRVRIERYGREDLTWRARATPAQIEAWEVALGATLPAQYREFLLQIGDGFRIKRQFGDLLVAGIEAANAPFHQNAGLVAFPFQSVIYDNYMHTCRGWNDLTGHEKMESDMALALGCQDWDYLALIVSGPQHGEVWKFRTFSWNPEVCGSDFISGARQILDKAQEEFERENPTVRQFVRHEMRPTVARISRWIDTRKR